MSQEFKNKSEKDRTFNIKMNEITVHRFAVRYNFSGSPYVFSIHQKPIQISLATALGLSEETYTQCNILDTTVVSSMNIRLNPKKKIFINKALITEVEQNFPFPISVSITGNNFGNKKETNDLSIYGAIIESEFKGNPDILLVSPETKYHSVNFIKNYHHVTCEDDLRSMLDYKVVKIPYYDDISEEFTALTLDENENKHHDKSKDVKINPDEYVIIKNNEESDIVERIKKLPKQYNFLNDEMIISDGGIDRKIDKSNDIYINKNIFDTFIKNEFQFIKQGLEPIALDELFVRIHNTRKSINNNVLWKADIMEPDFDKREYELSMVIEFTVFVS
jgi:hypothetical protein